jgi:hypothetical protein
MAYLGIPSPIKVKRLPDKIYVKNFFESVHWRTLAIRRVFAGLLSVRFVPHRRLWY